MKTLPWICLFVVLAGFVLVDASAALAQFKLPNPFAKKKEEQAPASYNLNDAPPEESKGFSLPKPKLPNLMPKKEPAAAAPAEPSRMSKVSQGTKNFFGGMKRVFMPWSNEAKEPHTGRSGRTASVTGTQRTYAGSPSARTAARETKEKKGFKFPWFGGKEEEPEQPPASVAEFLKRDRPGDY